jgi:hypothetical protein
MGGEPAGPVDKTVREPEDWERIADAIDAALGKWGFQTTDEHRRAIESLPNYRDLAYYERWASATERLLVEKGVLTEVEIDEKAADVRRRWEGV